MAINNSKLQDNYGGERLVARSVVVIGGVPTIPQSYDITMNSYLESDTANIIIPTELIDISRIMKNARKENKYVEVEIWAGYLNSQLEQHTFVQSIKNGISNDEIKKKLLREYRDKLSLRWFGLLDVPSIVWGDTGDITTLPCRELFTFLQDYAFEKKYEGENSTVKAIIDDIKKNLTGSINILVDKGVPENKLKVQMGLKTKYKKDTEEKTEELKEYNTNGKTYFDVIAEICKRAKLQFLQSENDLKTYVFYDDRTSDTLWELDRARDFKDCRINFGKIGTSNSNKVAFIVRSKQTGQEGDEEYIEGTFPTELTDESPESTRVQIITISNNRTKEECEQIAFDKASAYAKQSITGSFTVPNAIPKIKPSHLLNILDTSALPEKRRITLYTTANGSKMNFKITSITENFGYDGWKQSVEFELEPALNLLDEKTGEIKGYKLVPERDSESNSDKLSEIDMRLIDLSKLPVKLLFMRDSVSK